MYRRRWIALSLVSVLVGLVGCTPLGGWLYTDPALAAARLLVQSDSTAVQVQGVDLVLFNCNDYELTVTAVELQVNTTQGELLRFSSNDTLPVFGMQNIQLSVPNAAQAIGPVGTGADSASERALVLAGEVVLRTPIGPRHVPVRGQVPPLRVSAKQSPFVPILFRVGYGSWCEKTARDWRTATPDADLFRAKSPTGTAEAVNYPPVRSGRS